jgi:hypothetical protein
MNREAAIQAGKREKGADDGFMDSIWEGIPDCGVGDVAKFIF